MSIKLAVPEKSVLQLKPRISVIGVGGGGGNAVDNMINQKLEGVDFIVANTDAQALANSKASRKIQLGLEATKGLGAGARPEIGKIAAEEAMADIEREIEGSNMVFITAGLGGGTGSGAAPVVARIAKEKGILTVGVVTKPFQFEGRKRLEAAEQGLENFIKEVDSIIVIPNQNLFRVADKQTTLADAFIMADNVLYAGVRSITDLMLMPGLINLDFADIKYIMEGKGKAIMGTGEAEGEDRAIKAAEQALSNPLLDDTSMHGAKGVLINITGGNDITLFEIDEAASRIKDEVDEDAIIIFGSSFDESLNNKIRVSIVATGVGGTSIASRTKAKPLPISIEEPKPTPKISAPTPELDSNLEKFSATKTFEESSSEIIEIIEEETVVVSSDPEPTEDLSKVKNYDMLEKSAVIEDMPKASSLFKAIISSDDTFSEEQELSKALSANDSFAAKTTHRVVEEEPEIYPNHNPKPFAAPREEPEQLIVDEDEEYTPTLIERVTGFSIAKRNRKKKLEEEKTRYQEPISPSFSESAAPDDRLNLEIPSFLRRR
jgi:cell division protein FtsZ